MNDWCNGRVQEGVQDIACKGSLFDFLDRKRKYWGGRDGSSVRYVAWNG